MRCISEIWAYMVCKSAFCFWGTWIWTSFLLFTLKLNSFYEEFQLFDWICYYNFKLTLSLLNTIVCYSDGFRVSKSFVRVYSMGIVWSWRLQMPMGKKGKSSTLIVYAALGSAPCFCGLVGFSVSSLSNRKVCVQWVILLFRSSFFPVWLYLLRGTNEMLNIYMEYPQLAGRLVICRDCYLQTVPS